MSRIGAWLREAVAHAAALLPMNRRRSRRRTADRARAETAAARSNHPSAGRACRVCDAPACEHCPWCGTADHADDCPAILGVYPVSAEQSARMICADCRSPFACLDLYTLRSDADGFEPICLGCAAVDACS